MFKNFIWAFIEKGGQFVLQFIAIIILSRYLSPNDYGTFGIMTIFISVCEMLIDSGVGGAVVQKKNITPSDISTLFVTNMTISVVLYLLTYFASPYIAKFYGIPELSKYLRVLGTVIVLYALTIVHISVIQRELRLKNQHSYFLYHQSLPYWGLFSSLFAVWECGLLLYNNF